jgi:hypothetical protein
MNGDTCFGTRSAFGALAYQGARLFRADESPWGFARRQRSALNEPVVRGLRETVWASRGQT